MSIASDKDDEISARCAALGLMRPQAQALADAGPFPCTVAQVIGLGPRLADAGCGWRRKPLT